MWLCCSACNYCMLRAAVCVCVYQLLTCLIPVAVESKVQTQCVDNKENSGRQRRRSDSNPMKHNLDPVRTGTVLHRNSSSRRNTNLDNTHTEKQGLY